MLAQAAVSAQSGHADTATRERWWLMRVDLRAITAENLEDCIRLRPADDQVGYLSPNVYAIEETKGSPAETPIGIYHGEKPEGLGVYRGSPTGGHVWIRGRMSANALQHPA